MSHTAYLDQPARRIFEKCIISAVGIGSFSSRSVVVQDDRMIFVAVIRPTAGPCGRRKASDRALSRRCHRFRSPSTRTGPSWPLRTAGSTDPQITGLSATGIAYVPSFNRLHHRPAGESSPQRLQPARANTQFERTSAAPQWSLSCKPLSGYPSPFAGGIRCAASSGTPSAGKRSAAADISMVESSSHSSGSAVRSYRALSHCLLADDLETAVDFLPRPRQWAAHRFRPSVRRFHPTRGLVRCPLRLQARRLQERGHFGIELLLTR